MLVVILLVHVLTTRSRLDGATKQIDLLNATLKAEEALAISRTRCLNEAESAKADLYKQRTELQERLADAEEVEHEKACLFIARREQEIRADAIAKSKQVQKGFSAEHFAPFQMEFNPRDFRHAGDPVDYLVYAGGTDIKDGTSDRIEEILFLDIKTGQADLNKTQRRIRDAVVEGRVTFATWNPDTNILRRYPNESATLLTSQDSSDRKS